MSKNLFSRTDKSTLAQWWWSIDRWSLVFMSLLLGIGCILVMAASPAVAKRIGIDYFHFVKLHLLYVTIFFIVVFIISSLPIIYIKNGALLLYVFSICLLILIIFLGIEIKGAKRWIRILGFSVQPSEFLKPAIIVITAWMLDAKSKNPDLPGNIYALIFYGIAVILLILQPDMGMLFLISTVFFMQLFFAGLPLLWIVIVTCIGLIGSIVAYFVFPHVQQRINLFFHPNPADKFTERYQITQSLEAFSNGGLWGVGPGEGVVKDNLPDSHADFIFSVAGEEYGMFLCILIVLLFSALFVRNLLFALSQRCFFTLLVMSGIVFEIILQALINISSTLDLIPTKGMTLPFISYGGTSMLSMAISCGIILCMTKRQIGKKI